MTETPNNNNPGRLVSVQGPVVDVQFKDAADVPNICAVLAVKAFEGRDVKLEVTEHRGRNVAR